MSDPADHQEEPSGKRGEAAWKEHIQRIAARNERTRKEGKARRQTEEREKGQARRQRERREMAALLSKRGDPSSRRIDRDY
jgi:hypothetical protein